MPVVRCTAKLPSEIDDSPVADATNSPPSPVGGWYGHLFTVEHRNCIIFLNEPTLFVCLAIGVAKADYRDVGPFFRDVLAQTLRCECFSEQGCGLH